MVTQIEAPVSEDREAPAAPHVHGEIRSVPINEIVVDPDRRPLHDVTSLMESIAERGLLQPIVVLPIDDGYRLVAGLHRLEACRRLGWTEIPALVATFDLLDALLAEIDENLARVDLTELELAEEITRWKQAYETKYPDSVRPKGGRRRKNDAPRAPFSAYAATRLNAAPRSVEETIQIAANLTEDVKAALRDTSWADQRTVLRQLCRLEPEQQREVVTKLVSGQAHSVRQARSQQAKRDGKAAEAQSVDQDEVAASLGPDDYSITGAEARNRLWVMRAAAKAFMADQIRDDTFAECVFWLIGPSMTRQQVANQFHVWRKALADVIDFVASLPDPLRRGVPFVPPPEWPDTFKQAVEDHVGVPCPAVTPQVLDLVWDLTRGDRALVDDLLTLVGPPTPSGGSWLSTDLILLLDRATPEKIRRDAQRVRAEQSREVDHAELSGERGVT